MNISASSDYAVRAALYLAEVNMKSPGKLTTTEEISNSQGIPLKFLEALIRKLKDAKLVESKRGINGGHQLSLPPNQIFIADVIRAVDGPLAAVMGERPEKVKYKGSSKNLTDVWIAVRSSLRLVLEEISLEDAVKGNFSKEIKKAISQPGAWERR